MRLLIAHGDQAVCHLVLLSCLTYTLSSFPQLVAASSRVIARYGDGQDEGGQWTDRLSTTLGIMSFVLLNTIVDASVGAVPEPDSQVVGTRIERARHLCARDSHVLYALALPLAGEAGGALAPLFRV